MDVSTFCLKAAAYFLFFCMVSFILIQVLTFYKKRQSPPPIRTKASGVVEDCPEFTSIAVVRKRYLENISEWVFPKVFLGAFTLTVLAIIVVEN